MKIAHHLPLFSLIAAVGLLIVAISYNGARESATWSTVFYWIGLFILYLPISGRLLSLKASRQERIGLIITLGCCLYLVKLAYSPLEFKFPDELQHWRTEYSILQTGHLFSKNDGLPISPLYPGLEIVTNALISLSGLSIFTAGVIVIGIARLLFVLALFLFYEKVSQSAWIAGVASMLYMTNPHYLFLNSFFIYQSLALSLTALALFLIAKAEFTIPGNRVNTKLILLLALFTIIVTHHVTSYAFVIYLGLWAAASLAVGYYKPAQSFPFWTGILTLVLILTWILYVAIVTVDYVGEPISGVLKEFFSLIARQANPGEIFHAPDGPLFERFVSMGSVVLISIGLLLGFRLAWTRYRENPLGLSLLVGSLSYFGSLLIRLFSSQGTELAGRSWSFVFLVVSFVLAVGINEHRRYWRQSSLFNVVMLMLSTMIFLGGIMGGWPPYWGRLPGPYLVAAFERSIEPQGVAAAEWAHEILGPGNRIAGDFTNYTLMGAYGGQDPIRNLSAVYYSLNFGTDEQAAIRNASVQYLLVDNRLSSSIPISGRYFDPSELDLHRVTEPIDPAALAKFAHQKNITRIFDSGEIVIYDLGALSVAP